MNNIVPLFKEATTIELLNNEKTQKSFELLTNKWE